VAIYDHTQLVKSGDAPPPMCRRSFFRVRGLVSSHWRLVTDATCLCPQSERLRGRVLAAARLYYCLCIYTMPEGLIMYRHMAL